MHSRERITKISRTKLKDLLLSVGDEFGGSMREYISRKVVGKHLYELDKILAHAHDNSSILDVGGGMGVNLIVLKRANPALDVHLIDKLEEYQSADGDQNPMGSATVGLDIVNRSGVKLIMQDFWVNRRMPFESGSLDIVTCFDVIEHASENPLPLLKEIERILKPGGAFIMCAPNLLSTARRGRLLLGKHPYMHFDLWMHDMYDKYYGHYREYTRGEYHILLERAGFRDIESFMVSEPTRTKAINAYHHKQYRKVSLPALGLWAIYVIEIFFPSLRTEVYCVAKA